MAPGRNATTKIGPGDDHGVADIVAGVVRLRRQFQSDRAVPPAVPAAHVHDNPVARIPADLRGCGEIGGPVQVGWALRATSTRDLARKWRSSEAQPSNSTSDVAPVSMNLGSSSGCCRFDGNPGTQVTADTTPASANHGKKAGWYRPLG